MDKRSTRVGLVPTILKMAPSQHKLVSTALQDTTVQTADYPTTAVTNARLATIVLKLQNILENSRAPRERIILI